MPYTTEELTGAALQAAATLARGLRARATLVSLQVVPYPLPLDRPDVQVEFLVRKLRSLAGNSRLPVRIELVFTRNRADALKSLIDPGSLFVVMTENHWWRTAEERLARALVKEGCRVSLLTLAPGH